MARFANTFDLIGNTPLVDVSVLSPNPRVKVWAKLEGQNPGGSVKDRAALKMIETAEANGSLQPGQTVLESSSGNTGIALAMICRIKGYPLKLVLPENVSAERKQILEVWGAEITWSPGSEGSNGAMRHAEVMHAEHPEWHFLFQYGNPANTAAHYETTGPEILRDCPEVTHFVAGMGTGGTLMGAGRYLKENKPDVQLWAVEPPAGEKVDGLKSLEEGFIPPIFTDNGGYELLDRKQIVGVRDSIVGTRKLTDAGIFGGISSGAILTGALRCAAEIESGHVVVIVCDGGWKYMSTGAWTDDIDAVAKRATKEIYF